MTTTFLRRRERSANAFGPSCDSSSATTSSNDSFKLVPSRKSSACSAIATARTCAVESFAVFADFASSIR